MSLGYIIDEYENDYGAAIKGFALYKGALGVIFGPY